MYPKPLCIQSKMAGSGIDRGRPTSPVQPRERQGGAPHFIAPRGFYPRRDLLSRMDCSRGTPAPDWRSLPRPETPVTNPASAAASLAAPFPSLFSDSGSLAQKLVEAFLEVRSETE